MKLSYSLIAYHLQPENSHCWVNKVLGRKIPDNPAFEKGRLIHREIQGNIKKYTGILFDVEKQDYDENMKFNTYIGNYEIRGYLDGKHENSILEIKSGTKFWSIAEFMKSKQLAVYAYCNPTFNQFVCVTALSDIELWKMQPPKIFEFTITDKIRESGRKYIEDAILLFEKADFTGGLENGKCVKWCNYGENCYYRS